MLCSDLGFFPCSSLLYLHAVTYNPAHCTSFKSPLNRLLCCKWRQNTLSGGLLWCQWLVIFHFLCREPSHISSSSLHRFILLSFLNPLWSPHVSPCLMYAAPGYYSQPIQPIIFIFFCLQEDFATLCAKVWNLDTRGWKQTASSAGEVDRRVPMWVGMFVLFAACCRQPVVIRSVLIMSGRFNDEQVGALIASHDAASSLSASFIPQTFAASLVM